MSNFQFPEVRTEPSNFLVPGILKNNVALSAFRARQAGETLKNIFGRLGVSQSWVRNLSLDYGRCATKFRDANGVWPVDVDLQSSITVEAEWFWDSFCNVGLFTLQDLEGFSASQLILLSRMQLTLIERLAADAERHGVQFKRDFDLAREVRAAKDLQSKILFGLDHVIQIASMQVSGITGGRKFSGSERRKLFTCLAGLMVNDGEVEPIESIGIDRPRAVWDGEVSVSYNYVGESKVTDRISLG